LVINLHLLAPSILSADFSCIKEEIRKVESAGADMLHLDVMDGHFVPNITFGPKMVNDIRNITSLPLDVHLMISEPDKYIAQFAKAGADWLSVHYEASCGLQAGQNNPNAHILKRLLSQIKELGCKAGAVINPPTDVEVLDGVLDTADYILVMSVNPGFGGQKFIDSALDKAMRLRESCPSATIEMDGGIGLDNIEKVRDSGVNVFVCGNSIFGSEDVVRTIKKLKRLICGERSVY